MIAASRCVCCGTVICDTEEARVDFKDERRFESEVNGGGRGKRRE